MRVHQTLKPPETEVPELPVPPKELLLRPGNILVGFVLDQKKELLFSNHVKGGQVEIVGCELCDWET